MSNNIRFDEFRRNARSGEHAKAEAALAEALRESCGDPALCHVAGLFHYWRALEAESSGNGKSAEEHWGRAVPYLVYALESDRHMEWIRAEREQTYGQPISREQMQAARQSVYAAVDVALTRLQESYGAAIDAEGRQRIQRVRDEWRVELEGASLVRKLGGVPFDQSEGGYVVCGPSYARRCGFFDEAQRHIRGLPVTNDSVILLLNRMFGRTDDDEASVKRRAGYCFSVLALPYIYFRYKELDRALDFLDRQISPEQNGASDGAADLLSASTERSRDARQLAIEIRVEVGSSALFQAGEQSVEKALAYWGEAVRDVDVLDRQTTSILLRQGRAIKDRMQSMVQQRLEELLEASDWTVSLFLAERAAQILPDQRSINTLVQLLVRLAVRAHNEQNDSGQAVEYMQRARLLAPDDERLSQQYLTVLVNDAHHLLEAGECRPATDRLMDALGLCQDLLSHASENRELRDTRRTVISMMNYAFHKLVEDPQVNREYLGLLAQMMQRAILTETQSETLTADDRERIRSEYREIDCLRLFRRAAEHMGQGAYDAAFRDADRALETKPEHDSIKGLYAAAAAHAVEGLCMAGDLDRASEVAEQAYKRVPDNSEICLARTKVMIRRLGESRILSNDRNLLTDATTIVENWLGDRSDDEAQRQRARRYYCLVDPSLSNEQRLMQANTLFEKEHYEEALRMIAPLQVTGNDRVRLLFIKGLSCRNVGRLDEAVQVFEELVTEYPRLAMGRLLRGRIRSQAGRFKDAEEDLRLYFEHFPEETGLLTDLAINELRAGEFADALADLQTATRHEPPSNLQRLMTLTCLMHLGRRQEMPAVIAQGPQVTRDDEWYGALGDWFRGLRTDEDVHQMATSELRRGEFLYYLGEKARAEGRLKEAQRLFKERLAIGHYREMERHHAEAILRSGILDR
ncbi:MAG: tetratricopeptide repeat protein [Planctomycetaceae bacterium]|nr:tetratricopeptide repeat protein [Planctomycetaceae bacterium]